MQGAIGTLVFGGILTLHAVHVMAIGLLGLASGNTGTFVAALIVCILTHRCYKGIVRRYA